MVYKCDQCGAPLPAGVDICPNCGEEFSGIVPPDAEMPRTGFTATPLSAIVSDISTGPKNGLSRNPSIRRWLGVPAAPGSPAVSGAYGRALIVLAVVGVISLVVYFVK